MSIPLLEIKELNKYYYDNHVLKNLNITINEGIYLLKGENGSGKTTFLKIVLGLVFPTSGKITRNYQDYRYVPELLVIKSDVKVELYLKSVLSLRKLTRDLELEKYLEIEVNKRINTLSKGNLKKVLLYLAFVGKPDLLFLDEPLDGLDLNMKTKVINYLNDKRLNCLISSHLTDLFKNVRGVINFD